MWILPKNYPLSSHYVADMVVSKEDLSLLDSIIDSSLFVRSKPMSKSSLSRKWKRDTWFQRLCGQILKPSQHTSFETKLMSCLPVIPASPSAKPDDGGGKMIHDTCGRTLKNTLEQYDLFDVSSRTCKDTSRWDSPQSSQIWKNWVIEVRGEYSQRKKSALRIKEKECLSWPTPEAWTVQKYSLQKDGQEKTQRSKNLTAMALNGELSHPDQGKNNMNGKNQESWATPNTMGHLPSRSVEAQREMALGQRKGRSKPSNLREQVDPEQVAVYQEAKNWPTPTAAEGSKIGGQANYGQVGLSNHPSIVGSVTREKGTKSGKENWATPQARDWKGAEGRAYKGLTKDLPAQVELREKNIKSGKENWPTPTKSDMKDTWNGGRGETLVSKMKEKRSGKLNPDWCEQLMGLPVGWTKINDADDRISRLIAIGNGVVPQTAALAWVTLSEKIKQ